MRILYIGTLNEGGTCLDRLRSLVRLGHEVVGFDISIFTPRSRLVRAIRHRLKPRSMLAAMNDEILRRARCEGRFDCAWIDKGIYLFPETVVELKRYSSGRVVHFTPDPQLLFHRSRHFTAALPAFSHVVTTKTFEVDLYRAAGAREVILSQQSYCPERYAAPRIKPGMRVAAGFIGHFEKHYSNQLNALCRVTQPMVWGAGWPEASRRSAVDPTVVARGGVWGEGYVNTLASFTIGLGFLSKLIPEQHTTRTFEIPAATTFLLAERTEEHLGFFKEGIEAEFFGCTEELAEKAKFYLLNEAARRRIAERGNLRCRRSGYDVDNVLRRVLVQID